MQPPQPPQPATPGLALHVAYEHDPAGTPIVVVTATVPGVQSHLRFPVPAARALARALDDVAGKAEKALVVPGRNGEGSPTLN